MLLCVLTSKNKLEYVLTRGDYGTSSKSYWLAVTGRLCCSWRFGRLSPAPVLLSKLAMLEKEGLSCNLGELAWRTFSMHVINCSVCGTKQHANFPIKQEKQNLPVCRPVPMMTVTALSTLTHTVEGYTEEIQKKQVGTLPQIEKLRSHVMEHKTQLPSTGSFFVKHH